MSSALACASSCTSRPLKWSVTPEVAGSSPVAPALSTPHRHSLRGAPRAFSMSRTSCRTSLTVPRGLLRTALAHPAPGQTGPGWRPPSPEPLGRRAPLVPAPSGLTWAPTIRIAHGLSPAPRNACSVQGASGRSPRLEGVDPRPRRAACTRLRERGTPPDSTRCDRRRSGRARARSR